ncbi:cell division protein ZapE [Pseudomonas oryzihabitans]|uniref:cell division protein ZapE n=1 Tax=Pseudomonas oryzihabitans TaxID=47885 RepID=UPI0011A2B728|nr:cell division protein ZapE [Pseudomonas oryzihabitans]MBH3328860.1 cell division protein ZapE [Pseudomonas oryzihabitans]QEU02087.1 cell division protein ZapE [Pseudomonas oryzihabitans]
MTSPSPAQQVLAHFAQLAHARGYTLDAAQQAAIDRFAQLADELLRPRLFRRQAPRSLYLWGPVGRGKSFLLDGFFAALPFAEKRRVHFHAFFRELHERMFRQPPGGDALAASLDELLDGCRLLCFDEFHVHDIGDAMLITRLFKALFSRGVVLITTSNYPPEGLLPNPLYHERFLPAIRLIETRMDILSVAGPQDYRGASPAEPDPFGVGAYLWPGTPAQRQALGLPPLAQTRVEVPVGHRSLPAVSAADGLLHFSFADLCEGPTAVLDYLTLSESWQRWLLDAVPPLRDASPAARQRFINLVDVLYDRRLALFLVSAAPLDETLADSDIADMSRTRSRLSQLRQIGPD